MSFWPWVSRRAYDVVVDERDRLRRVNEELIAHFERVDRVERGMAETPRPERPSLKPMPKELRDYCQGWADPKIQRMTRTRLFRRHANGEDWDTIKAEVLARNEQEAEVGT